MLYNFQLIFNIYLLHYTKNNEKYTLIQWKQFSIDTVLYVIYVDEKKILPIINI